MNLVHYEMLTNQPKLFIKSGDAEDLGPAPTKGVCIPTSVTTDIKLHQPSSWSCLFMEDAETTRISHHPRGALPVAVLHRRR